MTAYFADLLELTEAQNAQVKAALLAASRALGRDVTGFLVAFVPRKQPSVILYVDEMLLEDPNFTALPGEVSPRSPQQKETSNARL